MSSPGEQRPAARVARARQGRLLGGVCAGLPDIWGLGTNGLRLVFLVTALMGGLGAVIYLVCWLVIPAADHDADADAVRTVVVLAWAIGALVAFVLVAVAAAAATLFGLGWLVFALAALVAAASLSPLRTRIPSVAALLGITALTVPAVAVALTPIRLTLQSGASIRRPVSYAAMNRTTYRSGLGTLLIDLRRTRTPVSGAATLRIDAGLRRTIVALPSDRCVHVRVNYDIHLFPAQFATLLTGRFQTPVHDVVLFGRVFGAEASSAPRGTASLPARLPGPLLTIDFTSQGGGLYVRDYPDQVNPDYTPAWPGFVAQPEPRPDLSAFPRGQRKLILHGWRVRRRRQLASERQITRLLPGPCAA